MSVEPVELNLPAQPEPAVSWLNWGALVLTPYWLFRNGFCISFAVYMCLALWIWPIEILMRLLFFLRGTRWSWGNGRRWRSYEEFATSQFNWAFVATIVLVVLALRAVEWSARHLTT